MRLAKLTDDELKHKLRGYINMYLLDYILGVLLVATGIYAHQIYGLSHNTPVIFFIPGVLLIQSGFFKSVAREYFRRAGLLNELYAADVEKAYDGKPFGVVKYHVLAIAVYIILSLIITSFISDRPTQLVEESIGSSNCQNAEPETAE